MIIVIKLGTSSICNEVTFVPNLANLALLVETVVSLRKLGHKVLLVSSGAIGMGLVALNMAKKPLQVSKIQALAAVGQGRLIALYDSLFSHFGVRIAQILLTRDNMSERSTYLNACATLKELLELDVVPIVNENDSVSSSEIRFGDNDSLAALTSAMIGASYLFLLTDVDALYSDNPRSNPEAVPIRKVNDIALIKSQIKYESLGSALGTGGMITKLIAAELATSAGCNMIITIGSNPQAILTILNDIVNEKTITIGTLFVASPNPISDRMRWLTYGLAIYGAIIIDAGAYQALIRAQRSSLFAAGILRVAGSFNANQCVRIVAIDASGKDIDVGKGLVNYTSNEITRIIGCKSKEIAEILGYIGSDFIIHRDNLSLAR